MRVLLVANYLPPYEGGIQFVVDELATRYVARGHAVRVAGYDATPDRRVNTAYARVALAGDNPLERRGVPLPLLRPSAFLSLAREVRWANAVHLHGTLLPGNAFVAVHARQRRVPVVVTEHVGLVDYGRPLLDRLQALALSTVGRCCMREARAVTVLNERVRDELRPIVGGGTRLQLIPNGVDTEEFQPATCEQRQVLRRRWDLRRPTAMFVGRWSPKKNVEVVVEAARRRPEWDLLVCGKDTEGIAAKIALPANLRVLGLLERDALAGLYRAADLLVLPSDGEGFPLVVQEALASGLPVVVLDNTTNRAYLDERCAVFVSLDAEQVGYAITKLFEDPERLDTMRDAARTAALGSADWSHVADAYLDLMAAQ